MGSDRDGHVRRYSPQDASACCEAINRAIEAMDGLNDAARRFVRTKNVAQELDAEVRNWYTLVYEYDGACVAMGALDGSEIRRLYVRPDAQARGVGEALLDALEAEASRRGEEQIMIEASPSAVSFYERRGYVARPEQTLAVGDAEFHFVPMYRWFAVQHP